jgi:hypothetical protein
VQLALECPTALLSEIQPLGDYDFCLTHLVLSDLKYAVYYANSNRRKILDNSTNELLHPVSVDDIVEAAGIVKPDFIMAPDFLGDYRSTLNSLELSCSKLPHDKIYPIIQGSTIQEVIDCLKGIVKLNFSRLAVPFDILTKREDRPTLEVMAKNRRMVVHMIDRSFAEYPIDSIHLLGVTTLEELKDYETFPAVETVDTGSPVLHGLKGLRYGRDKMLDKSTPTMNQMPSNASAHQGQLGDVYYNISYLRKYTQHE